MPRYYFHIVTAASILRDEEGSMLADLAEARAEAIKDARALMSAAILNGRDISSRRIDIFDETTLLLSVAFSQAIEPDP
jgi:hypothetical protein